jgi:hypothetical protein
MHEQHRVFEAPSNTDVPIWRYMGLAKFLSMLEAEALYFARADVMSDEFEGSVSPATLEYRQKTLGMSHAAFANFNAEFSADNEQLRSQIYLNCWCMSEHESTHMWEIYAGREPQGIAVRSTYRRLSESITDPRAAFIGTVKYIDFKAEAIADFGGFTPFLHKRIYFEFEQEIRAVHYLPSPDNGPAGIQISVDLDRLVEEVYVSPKAAPWFSQLVRSLLLKYGRTWSVRQSDLDGNPIY